jgi:hypothetical protein
MFVQMPGMLFENPDLQHLGEPFTSVMGRGESRNRDFNWEDMLFENPDLQHLGEPFT